MSEELHVPSFEEQMNTAVKIVLSMLPNKGAKTEGVKQVAHEAILNGNTKSALDISALVGACPECYGVPRKKEWWRVVTEYLSPTETLRAYMIRFPTAITLRQQVSIVDYLVYEKGYDEVEVEIAMVQRGFTTRLNVVCEANRRRKPERSEFC